MYAQFVADSRQLINASMRGRSRYATALAIVGAASLLGLAIHRLLPEARVSMIFLAGVVVAAVLLGAGPAYLSAGAAFGIYDFYLAEPRETVTLAPNDLVTLTIFIVLAAFTGRLGGRLRDQQRAAAERARLREQLFDASREFAATAHEEVIRNALARRVGSAAGGEAAIIDGQRRVGALPPPEVVEAARRAVPPDSLSGWRLRPLGGGTDRLGVAAWRDSPEALTTAERDQLIGLLVELGASSLTRARLAESIAQVEAAAETARLRATLLSSLSHDLRTPLASILASAGGLRQFGGQLEPRVREDMVATIHEEAERLSLFVDNLLNMTRLESGAVTVQSAPCDLGEVVGRVIARCASRQGGRSVHYSGLAGVQAMGDPVLLEQAFTNIVENAYRFSPPDGSLEILAERAGERLTLEFVDDGPGVPQADLSRIFEKFYRCSASQHIPGTGLGLSITKGMIQAMGGEVYAALRHPPGGLRLVVNLPAAA